MQAGFGSDYTEGRIDEGFNRIFGTKIKDNMLSGVLSDGIGGAIHDAGNAALQGYDPYRGNGWYGNWGDVASNGLSGFAKSGTSKFVGNVFDKFGESFSDKQFGKYSLMVPKQIIGGLSGQAMANFVLRLRFDQGFDGSDNWENMGASWGRDYWNFLKDF